MSFLTPHKFKYSLSALAVIAIMIGLLPSMPNRASHQSLQRAWEAHAETSSDYVLATLPPELTQVEPGGTISAVINIKNTGAESWPAEALRLGSVYTTGDPDRVSRWADESWESTIRIRPVGTTGEIQPGDIATFSFTLKAASHPGLYRETFQPVLEEGRWLKGDFIHLDFNVMGGSQAQSINPKEIRIYLGSQMAALLENGFIVAETPVSTGKAGFATPTGNYRVFNKFPEAQSSKYKLWMSNWMGLIREGKPVEGYGMHSLAYWRTASKKYVDGEVYDGRLYIDGRLYEDFDHLGTPMSHGCIRSGIYESGVIYNWAHEGMPVIVI